ncbi:CG10341 [Drosophila busckii]|uniref:H/ACA ribonucleoprotein complex non-core subunit NAF1 n=1 Tax=Drosophila busckii TaxID=30019 RepID=A0A0M4E7H2_DROBS|nr:H/ACA ribonucleoprotein complex non-core subunit NAF1 [Drosophila busckii]ALC38715.1 CG10341 [Drosophila busckii]
MTEEQPVAACSPTANKDAVLNVQPNSVEDKTDVEVITTLVEVENTSQEPTEAIEMETNAEDQDKSTEPQTQVLPQVEPTSSMEVEDKTDTPAANGSKPKNSNGLSMLATYSSDADSDVEEVHQQDGEVVEVPVSNITTNSSSSRPRQTVVVSDGSDSSSSSSSSDSEGEYLTVLRKKIDKRINNTEECDDDDDEFDDDSRPRRRQPPKVRGEMLLEDLPPIHLLEITVPEDECVELGKVQSIVDQLVLVSVLPNSMLFDLDTVLFLEKGRKVLGQVFDVLGQVADPLYCVRFNSNQEIKDRGINIGDVVYCAPQTEHTQFVILSKLTQVRGSDASWEHDVEPPERFVDYSDDEAEREARQERRKRRQRDRTNSTDSVDTVVTTNTEASEAVPPAQRQRGRRAQRNTRQPNNPQQNDNNWQSQSQSRSQSRDSQYNYHPSYNPGSWHSNYYHSYHPPAGNFNMPPSMPGMQFPMPTHGYGYMAPPPYGMPPMPMQMPPHMYPPPPAHPAYGQPHHHQQHPPPNN